MTNNFATFLQSRGWTPQNGQYLSPYTGKLHEQDQALLVEGIYGPTANQIVEAVLWPLRPDPVLEAIEKRP